MVMQAQKSLAGFLLLCIILIAYNYHSTWSTEYSPTEDLLKTYSEWEPYKNSCRHNHEWYVKHCFGGEKSTDVEDFVTRDLKHWSTTQNQECAELYETFKMLFEIHDRYSDKMGIPPMFSRRIKKWMKGDKALIDQIHRQHLVHVYSPLTAEHTVYNPVRAARPMPTQKVNMFQWVDQLAEESAKDCDFCKYDRQTAVDEFGRHETQYSARVSNTFKIERWHGMIVTRGQHHPTNFTRDFFTSFLGDCMPWILKVWENDRDYIYPNLAWDTLQHAGASQIHPHVQMMMSPDHYYGFMELFRQAGQHFYHSTRKNYFSTLVELYTAIGLAVPYGEAVALATLNGKTDLEVILLSPNPGLDLYRLLFYTIKAYHDSFTQLCYSIGMAWPAVGTRKQAQLGRIPAVIRLGSRSDCTSPRTDYSSFEIYQIAYRNHHPWKLAEAIRKAIHKYDV
ncbi:uncharacterized protein LOC143034417 isoform X2 [Oratosquilla oratoria]